MKILKAFEKFVFETKEDCAECDGTGKVETFWSCCGDEVDEDAELCPTCEEHIDGVEAEIDDCPSCS